MWTSMRTKTEDRANIPLENILSKERNRLLYHAIEHLPERQREIVMMQYFGGLGQKEIAKVLHMTPENVRCRHIVLRSR